MIDTTAILNLVQEEVSQTLQREPTVQALVSDMKRMVLRAVTKNGLSVDEAVAIASKLVVLASMVRG